MQQLRTEPAPGPRKPIDVDAEAARGTSGSAQSYPHRAEIEASMGRSVPAKAFFGAEASAACDALGAEAFAVGDSVVFATSNPSPRLAAHEATHVVQQSGGVSLSSGDGSDGDPLEQHADAVAERVVAGQLAGDLLPRHGAFHLPAVPQRKRVQRKVPDHAVTGAELSTRGGEQHAADLTDKQIHDAISWNDKQWTGKQRQQLRTFLEHKPADEGGFTEDDVRAVRQIQLGAGVEPAKADGTIGDTTMAILLQAGLTLGFEGGKAKAQDVQLLFTPGEFEDVAKWQAAVNQAIKDNPQAPYRAINEPSGTGRVYVKVKGNIVDVVNARGGHSMPAGCRFWELLDRRSGVPRRGRPRRTRIGGVTCGVRRWRAAKPSAVSTDVGARRQRQPRVGTVRTVGGAQLGSPRWSTVCSGSAMLPEWPRVSTEHRSDGGTARPSC